MAPPQMLHLVVVIREVDTVLVVSLEERPELNPEKHFAVNNFTSSFLPVIRCHHPVASSGER
jgi:hypothetical protein